MVMALTLHCQRLRLTHFLLVCFLVLQLRQRERWFIVHELHLATSENRTSTECHRSRTKGQRDCLVVMMAISLSGGLWERMVRVRVQRLIPTVAQSNLYQRPGLLHPLLLLLWPSGRQASLLGPLPHLSSLALQPVHSFLPSFRSLNAGVSRKMVLRPRATGFLNFLDQIHHLIHVYSFFKECVCGIYIYARN